MGDDLYRRLGIARGASPEQIKRAYRKLSKKLHPDVGGDPAEFAKATEAYDVLSDPAQRIQYDATGQWRSGSAHDLGREVHDPITKEAMGVLAQTLKHLIESAKQDIGLIPVVDALTNVINDGLKQAPEMIAGHRRIKEMIERNVRRMKRRGEGENLLAGMLKMHASHAQHMIEQVELRIKIGHRCLEILKDHSWEVQQTIAYHSTASNLGNITSFFRLGGVGT